MTLAEVLALNSKLTIENLHSAYRNVIRKLRLDIVALPVLLDQPACKVDGFNSMARVTGTESEVAIKEIVDILGVTFSETEPAVKDTFEKPWIGNIDVPGYGFDTDVLAASNGIHTIAPHIYWTGNEIQVTNVDDIGDNAFFWITAYVYPYFAIPSESPYEVKVQYDFTTVNTDDYDVDIMLMYPIVAKAMALAYQELGDIVETGKYDNMSIQYIKIYNKNFEQKYTNHLTIAGDHVKGALSDG